MDTQTLYIGFLIAARVPLYLYVAVIGWQNRHEQARMPMKALAAMGALGATSAILSAFTSVRLLRDFIGGAFAILLFFVAYEANQKIIRRKQNGTKTI